MYYVLTPGTTADGDMIGLTHKKDFPERDYFSGSAFVDSESAKPWDRPPAEPLQLIIKKGRETAPLPSFLRQPVPGVENVDVYRAELRFLDGRLASDEYFVFNLLGAVKGVDLAKSTYDAGQPSTLLSMGFDSLTIDPAAARDLLMFRLAENITTIIVHERIKKAIEAARIPLINVDPTTDVALL